MLRNIGCSLRRLTSAAAFFKSCQASTAREPTRQMRKSSDTPNWERLVKEADRLLHRLFPICRSITGEGVRETISVLRNLVDLEVREVASGTRCYDWRIPREWNVRAAYIESRSGRRIVDFSENNLHLVGYSAPVDAVLPFHELAPHLHTLPHLPQAIPYRTTYYRETWGFCLAEQQRRTMDRSDRYHVVIDSTLKPGALTYAQARVAGNHKREFLFSTYCCHPSMANDNLSGVVLWTLLLREMRKRDWRFSYRFVVAPETIGAIAYLWQHEKEMENVAGGYVLTTVAGPGRFGYKRSFQGDHLVDIAARDGLRRLGARYVEYPFDVHGSDERQFSAPRFRVPMGTITKDKYYEYPYYHTSLDNLAFVNGRQLVETLKVYWNAAQTIDGSRWYASRCPHCEPMLSRRSLYPELGGGYLPSDKSRAERGKPSLDALLWTMFLADGRTAVETVAQRSGLSTARLERAADILVREKLLAVAEEPVSGQ